MRDIRRTVVDTVDASLEMPEQYGSRTYWRYNQVRGLLALVALPLLLGMYLVGTDTLFGRAANFIGWAVIVLALAWFILRDRIVQKRVDETGCSLEVDEPY